MELESRARTARTGPGERSYPLSLRKGDGLRIVDSRPLFEALLEDIRAGVPAELSARRFHDWLIRNLVELCSELSAETGIKEVLLGGGCMANVLLLTGLIEGLEGKGLDPYAGERVPSNDGGLSLGQAVIGGLNHVSRHPDAGH